MAHFQVERLKRLPLQADEVWQGGLVRLPLWDERAEGGPQRLWAAVWMSPGREAIHMSQPQPANQANYALALDALVEMAVNPKLGGYRPGEILVNDSALAEHLGGLLAEVDIRVRHEPQLAVMQRGLAQIPELQPTVPLAGSLSGKGVTVDRLHAYAEAAAEFYRAEPWVHLNDSDLLHVEAPKAPKGFECCVVMGEGGQTFGLGLFTSALQYEKMMRGGVQYFQSGGAWSVTFDAVLHLPIDDADLWEDHRLPVSGPQAFPLAYHHGPGDQTKRPNARQLAYLEGLLRAIARSSEQEIDRGRWNKTVETFDGPVEYSLAIPRLLAPLVVPRTTRDLGVLQLPDGLQAVQDLAGRLRKHRPSLGEQEALQQALRETGTDLFEAVDEEDRPLTPAEQADYLADRADDELAHRMRVRLARMALELDPDCIEAYVQLGLVARDPEEMLHYCREAMAAGQRSLSAAQLRSPDNPYEESRRDSYLFAWLGVVKSLAQLERFEEAVREGQELLKIDRQDEQTVRYVLLACLLVLGHNEPAEELWRRFPGDDHPVWLYARALLTFRRESASAGATERLLEALEADDALLAEQLTGEGPAEPEDEEEPTAEGYGYTAQELENEPALQEMMRDLSENLPKYLTEGLEDALDDEGYEHEPDEVTAEEILVRAWQATDGAVEWLQRELQIYREGRQEEDR